MRATVVVNPERASSTIVDGGNAAVVVYPKRASSTTVDGGNIASKNGEVLIEAAWGPTRNHAPPAPEFQCCCERRDPSPFAELIASERRRRALAPQH